MAASESPATHPNIRLPGDGPESRMRMLIDGNSVGHRIGITYIGFTVTGFVLCVETQGAMVKINKYGDDAEKKNSEEKKQKEVRVDVGE